MADPSFGDTGRPDCGNPYGVFVGKKSRSSRAYANGSARAGPNPNRNRCETAGEFTIFAKTGPATIKKAVSLVEHEDFVGKYELHKRTLNAVEESLVPKLPEWYIIPQEVVDICKHAQATTGKSMQMRNFLLRGPAGTGKTMGAKAIASGLHLPYMKYTCSAGTEIFDFVGMIFPDSDSASTGDAQLDKEKETLKSMGGVNYANVSKLMGLPDPVCGGCHRKR